ncbi:MAG TPA: ATP-binding protein [Kofleriaceae bacterium]|nr:ATP-binding protein [Kofleriaceae bacterium]
MRVALPRVVRAAFSVAGAPDPDAERRSRLLLVMAAAMMVLLVLSAATIPLVRGNAQTWLTVSPIGVLAMLVTFSLARRGRADAGALVLSVFAVAAIVGIAWSEGPGGVRMSVAVLGVVAVGSVLSTRLTAAVGLGLAGVIGVLGASRAAGLFGVEDTAHDLAFGPFIRQSISLGLMVMVLRRSYDRLGAQVRDRERACVDAVASARAINSSLEARVAERTAVLQATRDRLSDLAAQLTADVRGHLGAMRSQLEEFAGAEVALGPAALRDIAKASNAAARLSLMTERLHEHATLGATALRPARIAMDALIRELIDEYGRACPGVEWRVEALPPAWGDPALVRTVVQNLLDNAVKFSRKRLPPRVEIGHDADRGYFVRDNGVGFDPARASNLFAPFHRLHREDEFEGHGLGLANVRRILHRMGGDIAAHGEPDAGATFFFRLATPGGECA